jgi:hypothetical protein
MMAAVMARIAPSSVWLVCACQGCPWLRRALRAVFLCWRLHLDSARRAGAGRAIRISRRDLWPEAENLFGQRMRDAGEGRKHFASAR